MGQDADRAHSGGCITLQNSYEFFFCGKVPEMVLEHFGTMFLVLSGVPCKISCSFCRWAKAANGPQHFMSQLFARDVLAFEERHGPLRFFNQQDWPGRGQGMKTCNSKIDVVLPIGTIHIPRLTRLDPPGLFAATDFKGSEGRSSSSHVLRVRASLCGDSNAATWTMAIGTAWSCWKWFASDK